MDAPFTNLFGVAAVAFLVPFVLGFFPRLRLPVVVVELIAGIVVGPSLLGWIDPGSAVTTLSSMGVAFLLFLAGMELDLGSLRGRPARRGTLGFALTFALALALSVPLGLSGVILSPLFIAIALSATSVGIILPVLRDTGRLATAPGLYAIAGGSVAEFATIALLGVFFARGGSSAIGEIALMLVLGAFAVGLLLALRRAASWEPGRRILDRLDETTSQPRVRFAVLVVVAAASLSLAFGFEAILGTFLAGIVFAVVIHGDRYERRLRAGVEAIGFGFFVPVFFITSGLHFDVGGMADPSELSRVALFVGILVMIHIVPALALYLRELGARTALAVGLLQATNLSFLVVAVAVGRELDRLSQINDSALIVAGLTSAVIFPALAQFLLGNADDQADSPARAPSTAVSTSPGVANPARSPQRRTPRDASAPPA